MQIFARPSVAAPPLCDANPAPDRTFHILLKIIRTLRSIETSIDGFRGSKIARCPIGALGLTSLSWPACVFPFFLPHSELSFRLDSAGVTNRLLSAVRPSYYVCPIPRVGPGKGERKETLSEGVTNEPKKGKRNKEGEAVAVVNVLVCPHVYLLHSTG